MSSLLGGCHDQPIQAVVALTQPSTSGLTDARVPQVADAEVADTPQDQPESDAASSDVLPWGTPEQLSISDPDYEDQDPVMSPNGLELYFSSTRPGEAVGGHNIWRATRAQPTDEWGTPEPVTQLNTTSHDYMGSLSADALTLWFATRGGASSSDLFVTTRSSLQDAWASPEPLPQLTPTDSVETAPSVTLDGLHLFFVYSETGGAGPDLVVAERDDPADSFGLTELVPGIPTAGSQWDPFSNDGLELYYGMSGDLYRASRSSLAAAFEPSEAVDALNTDSDEGDPFVTADGTLILFASTRGSTVRNLYQATR